MKNIRKQFHSGFTLIEMIVSLGVFSIIITTAIGALLVLISSNQKLQGEQSVMTNLSFALDGMTREIRTGYAYFCDGVNNQSGAVPATGGLKIFDDAQNDHEALGSTTVRDCTTSTNRYHGVSFVEGGNSVTAGTANRIMYYIASTTTEKKLMRRVGNSPAQSIVASGLEIIDADFIVTGSTPRSAGDNVQPTVTVYIEAKEISQDKIYRLETTVTQRVLDL
jgi:prepilin-type N-terminal cleavage/methylation domain-containing protein